jgi:hypothetical protein
MPQPPQQHGSQLLDFKATTWCVNSDDELKALTWSSFAWPDEKTAKLMIWDHSANAAENSSIQVRGSPKQLKNRRFVEEELNRIGLRLKHATVVLILQADLRRTKKYSSLVPVFREVLKLVKKAAQVTKDCNGIFFNSGDRWYDACTFFNKEVVAEPPVWGSLKDQYDRDLMKELRRTGLESEQQWIRE